MLKEGHRSGQRSVNHRVQHTGTRDMEENKPKTPMQETTKDDSSDVERVKQDKQGPPPQPRTGKNSSGSRTKEEEEAEKGHS